MSTAHLPDVGGAECLFFFADKKKGASKASERAASGNNKNKVKICRFDVLSVGNWPFLNIYVQFKTKKLMH